jgi:hypothetical protein
VFRCGHFSRWNAVWICHPLVDTLEKKIRPLMKNKNEKISWWFTTNTINQPVSFFYNYDFKRWG